MTDEFVTEGSDQATPGQLRQKLEAEIAARKAVEKRLAEYETASAQRAVADTWQKLQVPESIRSAYRGDEDPAAIEAWWKDYGSLFNIEQAAAVAPQETQEQKVQREQIEATQAAANLGSDTATGYEAGFSKPQELKTRKSAITQADIDDVFSKLGLKDN